MGCKVKVSQNTVPKSISYILESSIHTLCAWMIGFKKWHFHVKKMTFHMSFTSIVCPDSQTLRAFFCKINVSPICYDVINKITLSWECNVLFQKCSHQNSPERTAFWQMAKSQFWTSDPTGLFRCVGLSYLFKLYLLLQIFHYSNY